MKRARISRFTLDIETRLPFGRYPGDHHIAMFDSFNYRDQFRAAIVCADAVGEGITVIHMGDVIHAIIKDDE